MKSKGQTALEILVILGILVIGATIFGAIYLNQLNEQAKKGSELSGLADIFLEDFGYNDTSTNPLPCNNNGVCDSGENSSNCLNDCYCGNGVCDSGEYCYTCEPDCGSCNPIGSFSDFNLVLDPVGPSVINSDFNIIADINSNNSYANIVLVEITKYDDLSSNWTPTNNCEFNGDYNSIFTNIGQLLPSGTDILSNTFTFSCNTPGNYNFKFTVSSPDGSNTLVRTIIDSGYTNGKEIIMSGICEEPLGTPQFSPAGGTFTSPVSVSLSYTDPNCSDYNIHYTLDGTEPTKTSTIYSTEIHLQSTTTIKAKVFAKNYLGQDVNGDTNMQTYTLNPPILCLAGQPGGGSGTLEDPKIICTPKELHDVRDHGDWNYVLGQDIDLNHTKLSNDPTATWYDDVNGWAPIYDTLSGSYINYFDGGNHNIINLYINRPSEDYVGLFGRISKVQQINLLDINIIGKDNVGGVAGAGIMGYNDTQIKVTGSILGVANVGGIVGYGSGINHSSFEGKVVGNNYVGGIIGIGTDTTGTHLSYLSVDGNVMGNNYVGGLAGYTPRSIANSNFSGFVSGKDYVGGIAGSWHSLNNASFYRNYSRGTIIGSGNYVGGLLGQYKLYNNLNAVSSIGITGDDYVYSGYGIVSESYFVGQVFGNNIVGGLVGRAIGGVIQNCYSVSEITGNYSLGGLVGHNSDGVINKSFSVSTISGDFAIGGLVGNLSCISEQPFFVGSIRPSVTGSFYNLDLISSEDVIKGSSKTTIEMTQANTFPGWFVSSGKWAIDTDSSYPYLKNIIYNENNPKPIPELKIVASPSGKIFTANTLSIKLNSIGSIKYTVNGNNPSCDTGTLYSSPITITEDTTIKAIACKDGESTGIITENYILVGPYSGGGNGTIVDPYLILTPTDLNKVTYNLHSNFKLGANLDLNISPYNVGEGWNPIGNNSIYKFTGVFDGSNNIISNLYINRPTTENVGLFSSLGINCSEIKNLNLNDVNVTGKKMVGGLLGAVNYGTLSENKVLGSIYGETQVGGLAGYNSYGVINFNSVEGLVSGTDNYIGGLIGQSNYGSINNSYFSGLVSGKEYTGGLIGLNFRAPVSSSYSRGLVSGKGEVGGLIGYANESTISNAYSTSTVLGNYFDFGGLVGTQQYGKIENSFATGNVVGGSSVGGLVGGSHGQIENSFATGDVNGYWEVGGLIGDYYFENSSNIISNNYSLGDVTLYESGTYDVAGGFVGRYSGYGILNNNYSIGRVLYADANNPENKGFSGTQVSGSGNFWDINASGQTTSPEGATGKTTTEMKTWSTFSDWNLSIWAIDPTINNGYPYLRNNPPQ